MGRHVAPPPGGTAPDAPDAGTADPRGAERTAGSDPCGAEQAATADPGTPHPWREHAVLALVAGLTVGAVMLWAGSPWPTALAGALGGVAVVLAAGWIAARLPGHDGSGAPRPPSMSG
ncbi:MAG TPA: hypothetical protein VN257_01355 [Actinotalea sp.]|nr:hypothetical protein [Actinotalea sp.]